MTVCCVREKIKLYTFPNKARTKPAEAAGIIPLFITNITYATTFSNPARRSILNSAQVIIISNKRPIMVAVPV